MLALTGQAPASLGVAGNPKLTHAIALHAMQVLPLVAWWLAPLEGAAHRLTAMHRAIVGYALILLWALWQAGTGRAPSDVTSLSAILAGTGGLLLAWPVASATLARLAPDTRRPSRA